MKSRQLLRNCDTFFVIRKHPIASRLHPDANSIQPQIFKLQQFLVSFSENIIAPRKTRHVFHIRKIIPDFPQNLRQIFISQTQGIALQKRELFRSKPLVLVKNFPLTNVFFHIIYAKNLELLSHIQIAVQTLAVGATHRQRNHLVVHFGHRRIHIPIVKSINHLITLVLIFTSIISQLEQSPDTLENLHLKSPLKIPTQKPLSKSPLKICTKKPDTKCPVKIFF